MSKQESTEKLYVSADFKKYPRKPATNTNNKLVDEIAKEVET